MFIFISDEFLTWMAVGALIWLVDHMWKNRVWLRRRDKSETQMVLHCWHDFGAATCMLPDGHDGDHEPTLDDDVDDILVRFTDGTEEAG